MLRRPSFLKKRSKRLLCRCRGSIRRRVDRNKSFLVLFSKKFHTSLWRTLLDETEQAYSSTFPASPKSDGGLRTLRPIPRSINRYTLIMTGGLGGPARLPQSSFLYRTSLLAPLFDHSIQRDLVLRAGFSDVAVSPGFDGATSRRPVQPGAEPRFVSPASWRKTATGIDFAAGVLLPMA